MNRSAAWSDCQSRRNDERDGCAHPPIPCHNSRSSNAPATAAG